MDESTRAAFRITATGLWNLGMTLQVHLASMETAEPGPISKHQMIRLLRDLEKQVDQLQASIERIGMESASRPDSGTDSEPDFEPDEPTRVRTDLPV